MLSYFLYPRITLAAAFLHLSTRCWLIPNSKKFALCIRDIITALTRVFVTSWVRYFSERWNFMQFPVANTNNMLDVLVHFQLTIHMNYKVPNARFRSDHWYAIILHLSHLLLCPEYHKYSLSEFSLRRLVEIQLDIFEIQLYNVDFALN